jgi:hypothetical protein
LDFASQKQLCLQFGWTDFDEIKQFFKIISYEKVIDKVQKYGCAFFGAPHPV